MTKKPAVPERLRRQVQERAQGRCEYCLIHEADMYYPHEPDHVIAEKPGSSSHILPLACPPQRSQKTTSSNGLRPPGFGA